MNRTTLCACVPAGLGAFDFGLLALAGPRVASAVGATGDAYPWLFSASSFAYGAAVIPAAGVVARLGSAWALALGLAVAAAGTVALAAAAALGPALAARVLFGLGGALAATAALALLAGIADESARRAAFAAFGGAVGCGFAAGAVLASLSAWRPVFALAGGACAVAALACTRLADAGRPDGAMTARALAGVPHTRAARASARALAGASTARAGRAAAGGLADAPPARATAPGLADAPPARASARGLAGALPAPGVLGGVPLAGAVVLVAVALTQHGALLVAGLVAGGALAGVGLRRAAPWLPAQRSDLARVCAAGAATTGSGVSATILVGAALVAADQPTVLLGVFGLAVVPGARLARVVAEHRGLSSAAAAGLVLQALGVLLLAFAADAALIAAAVAVFGVGHVAANAGVAGTAATLAGPAAPAVGALLVAAQYVGGGVGPVLIAGLDTTRGLVAAATIAALGALTLRRPAAPVSAPASQPE